MSFIIDSKIVASGEILFCTHIDIVVFRRIEHSVESGFRWHTYRAGRQSVDVVCVVGRCNEGVLLSDAPQRVVADSKFGCRVALQLHAFLYAVEV